MPSYTKFIIYILSLNLLSNIAYSQKVVNPLDSILKELIIEFPTIGDNLDSYEIQILYTQINQLDSIVSMESFEYNLDTNKYFYPASTVKMPVAFLALEKLEKLQDKGIQIDLDTPIKFEALDPTQTPFDTIKDQNSAHQASLRRLIQQVFSVSDNNAYNRLYEFLGRDSINVNLREKGVFHNSRIIHRVGVTGFDHETNGLTNPYYFYDKTDTLYHEEMRSSTENFLDENLTNVRKGKGFYLDTDSTDMRPFNMYEKNFVNIKDLENSLIRMVYPENFTSKEKFNLNEEHRTFLIQSMARLPREYQFPKYDSLEYYDSYGKFFLFGHVKENIPNHIRIFNKVGYAYGTLTDCAFIVDYKNDIAFFLTATILVNENQIFNDGIYEYDEIGIPFLSALGRKIYDYELKRDSKPIDLRAFELNFSEEFNLNYIHSK